MKSMAQLKLEENERMALSELKEKLLQRFPDAEIILYGSKTRGDYEEGSDIDILVLLDREVNNSLEEEIFSLSFKVELNYDVVFGVIAYSKQFWNSDLGKAMPLHWNVDKDGIPVSED